MSLSLADGTQVPPPTTFSYSSSARAFAGNEVPLDGVDDLDTEHTGQSVSIVGLGINGRTYTDVTGDGMPDYVGGIGSSPNDGPHGRVRVFAGGFKPFGGDFPEFTEIRIGAGGGNPGLPWGAAGAVDPVYFYPEVSSSHGRLIDMDGDGLPDFVRSPTMDLPGENPDHCCHVYGCPSLPCVWEVFRNIDGQMLDPDPEPWPGAPADALNYVGGQRWPATDIIDLTGDGRPDLINCANRWPSNGWYTCHLYPNTGSSFGAPIPWQVPDNPVGAKSSPLGGGPDPYTRLKAIMDLNGDGLPDMVSTFPYPKVWLNSGRRFEPEESSWPGLPTYLELAPNDNYVSHGMRDMNGDGLVDSVNASSPGDEWWVRFNTGGGFAAEVQWTDSTLPPGVEPDDRWLQNRRWGPAAYAVIYDVLDINGDGLADRVGEGVARMGQGLRGSLMVSQENGLGARWEVNYRESKSTNVDPAPATWQTFSALDCTPECPHLLPFPAWVVRDIVTDPDTTTPGGELQLSFNFRAPYFDRTTRTGGVFQVVEKC